MAGGIAAYKCLELIRRLADAGIATRCILTEAGSKFVTPLSLAALSGDTVYQDLFSLTDENAMGHIELSRSADLVVVAPATADLLAKMAHGLAGDLASTALLATDKPILVAPAMNVRMWEHPATQANLATLAARGVRVVGPGQGAMACGEYGFGRMAEPAEILSAVQALLGDGPLKGVRALVTSGPTREAVDPVRYLSNHSSGKQGHAIASALARLGARVTLVSGPVELADPPGVTVKRVQSADQMMAACARALPAEVAVCCAAVADWKIAKPARQKLKKEAGQAPPALALTANPDILASLSSGKKRPRLMIGFAAETENVIANAKTKRARKKCDWIVANDVSEATGTFGGDDNTVHVIDAKTVDSWPRLTKEQVAERLAARIAKALATAPRKAKP